MQAVFETLRNVIDNDATVLLYGESGTGKEIVARAIHFNSGRRRQPFVPMDCASIPATLFETELFGFEKGAFTGANKTTRGKFEIANGGTLFLDEVSNISLDAQAKLLRILQEREFSRIGGEAKIAVNVRLISASNKKLPELIRTGEFREDLYYRLNVIPINLPALRERKEDVPILIDTFLERFNKQYSRDIKFGASVMKTLLNYNWPGNVRELENFIHRVVLTSESGVVNDSETLRELTEKPTEAMLHKDALDQDLSLEIVEKLHIERMLKRHHHNISGVSKILGLTRKTLYAKMEKYGIKSAKD
jgi:transcriptional regulator with PAS, ATPase and Fis domain